MDKIDGLCPKCQTGKLSRIEGSKSVALRFGNRSSSTYKIEYQCDNHNCDYKNVTIGVVV